MLSRRFNEQLGSEVPRDPIHPSLQPVALDLERSTLGRLRRPGERDDAGIHLGIQEDNARLLFPTPDKAHAARLAMACDDQVDIVRDWDGIRENHLRPIWGQVSHPAFNREARVPVFDGAAEQGSSALDLTTFDHLPPSHRIAFADRKSGARKLFAEARHLTGLMATKVKRRWFSPSYFGVAA